MQSILNDEVICGEFNCAQIVRTGDPNMMSTRGASVATSRKFGCESQCTGADPNFKNPTVFDIDEELVADCIKCSEQVAQEHLKPLYLLQGESWKNSDQKIFTYNLDVIRIIFNH